MWDDGKPSKLIFLLKAVRYSLSRDGKALDEGDASISAHSIIGTINKLSLTDGKNNPLIHSLNVTWI